MYKQINYNMRNKAILQFAKTLSGIFSNKDQALENPKNFAHIEIHIRPLFFRSLNCFAFYSEQRYQHDIWNPYKQNINKLYQEKDIFILSNHQIEDKERLTGSALDLSILSEISKYKLNKKHGCSMHFKENSPGIYTGNLEPGEKCYIQRGKEKTYVKSLVIINNKNFISEDSGYEIKTNKKAWGSKFGPLVFKKLKNFDNFIDTNWE